MSTATTVPETRDLEGDSPVDAIEASTPWWLVRETVDRFRFADGFSHARATAFQVVLALIPGMVVVVALAVVLQWGALESAIIDTVEAVTPGPTSDVLRDAFEQGGSAGRDSDWAAIVAGTVALLVSGTTAFGQLERAANRIYGIEADRPAVQKYRRALLLCVTAGVLMAGFLVLVGLGAAWGGADDGDGARRWWAALRWPAGALVLAVAMAVVFHTIPRRRQPRWPWLMAGATIASAGVVLVSLLLAGFLQASGSFGETYGPLAGFLGLLLWAYLSSLALYLGLAFAAQLEAVRGGLYETRSTAKVEAGEPDAQTLPYATALRRHA